VILANVVIAVLWSVIFQFIYGRLFPRRQMLLVYGERPMFHLMQKISTREDKYQICNIIHYDAGVDAIMEVAHNYDAIIVGDIPAHERNQLLKSCFGAGIRTYTVPKISDIINRSSDDLNLFDTPLLLSRNEELQIEQLFLKRAADIVFSLIGLIITSPFFLVIAAMIKATDGGPVFYKQVRLTKDRQEFMIYKFRTMIQDAEKDGHARLAAEGDDRILPVGRFLRATRLDELPQLINILKGEMSLVGPRPERPELAAEIEKELPEFAYRLKVKAGLTGYAQIYGKYNTTSYDKLKLDLTYIRNYSFFLDLKLMIMTPKNMLLKESTEGVMEHDERLQKQEEAAAEMDITDK
jgi:exopolysaccharide biosynthesis polyprenyl glycosylphosphotransferase